MSVERDELLENLETLRTSKDAFDRLISQGVKNDLDIASQYKFSPERLRLFLNGSREFVQYGENTASKFSDDTDTWTLQPGPGDTMRIESAESSTYIVGTEMRASTALRINQSLQSGDVLRVGPRNTRDGWFIEQRGADHSDREVDIKQLREGTETVLQKDVKLQSPLTQKTTITCYYNWYNVGEQRWVQTFSNGGEQSNREIATTSTEPGTQGPSQANLNLYQEIQASSTGLELEVGSMSMLTQAQAQSLLREKPVEKTVTLPAANSVWHPIYAFRIRSSDSVTNARLSKLAALNYTNSASIQLVAVSVDPSKTDATGFDTPGLQQSQNSVIQDTENVSELPSSSGTQTAPSTTDFKFGGYTLSYSSITGSGDGLESGTSRRNPGTQVKRNVLESDVVIVLAKSPDSGGDVTFNLLTEQDW